MEKCSPSTATTCLIGSPYFVREREVAFVVRRHAHHRAVAVAHQHVVADPDLDALAGQRVRHVQTGRHALLLHRRDVGLDHAAPATFVDERGELRVRLRRLLRQRMLGGHRRERHAHDRVRARRENVHAAVADQLAIVAADIVREREAHALALADPVRLHRLHAFGPAGHLVQVFEQLLGVVGDAKVVAGDLALLDDRAGAPAAPVDHLLVCEHRLVHRIPVDDLRRAVRDATLQHAQEQPLVPAVVVRVAGGDLARPVDRKAHRLHLLLHVRDVLARPLRRRLAVLDRRVLRGQSERVPTHRHQHVLPAHAQMPVHDVVDRVVAHVAHVQLARRIRAASTRNRTSSRPAFR